MRCSSVKPAASRRTVARGWRVPGSGSSRLSERTRHPDREGPADHLGSLLLAASRWRIMPQKTRARRWSSCSPFYILPWCGTMLGKVEARCAHAVLAHHGAVDPRRHRRDVGRASRKKMSNNDVNHCLNETERKFIHILCFRSHSSGAYLLGYAP